MKRISSMKPVHVRLTAEQEKRLAKLYNILDMINPAESNQQSDNENEKTMIIAEANPNF